MILFNRIFSHRRRITHQFLTFFGPDIWAEIWAEIQIEIWIEIQAEIWAEIQIEIWIEIWADIYPHIATENQGITLYSVALNGTF